MKKCIVTYCNESYLKYFIKFYNSLRFNSNYIDDVILIYYGTKESLKSTLDNKITDFKFYCYDPVIPKEINYKFILDIKDILNDFDYDKVFIFDVDVFFLDNFDELFLEDKVLFTKNYNFFRSLREAEQFKAGCENLYHSKHSIIEINNKFILKPEILNGGFIGSSLDNMKIKFNLYAEYLMKNDILKMWYSDETVFNHFYKEDENIILDSKLYGGFIFSIEDTSEYYKGKFGIKYHKDSKWIHLENLKDEFFPFYKTDDFIFSGILEGDTYIKNFKIDGKISNEDFN